MKNEYLPLFIQYLQQHAKHSAVQRYWEVSTHRHWPLGVDHFGCSAKSAKRGSHAPQGIWAGMLKRHRVAYSRSECVNGSANERERERETEHWERVWTCF